MLLPPRISMPAPVLIRPVLAPTPVTREAPDWVTAPMRLSVPAADEAVLPVAIMTPLPMLVGAAEPK